MSYNIVSNHISGRTSNDSFKTELSKEIAIFPSANRPEIFPSQEIKRERGGGKGVGETKGQLAVPSSPANPGTYLSSVLTGTTAQVSQSIIRKSAASSLTIYDDIPCASGVNSAVSADYPPKSSSELGRS